MNIYVGNLSYEVTEQDLQDAFGVFGDVESTKIIKDPDSGKSKGFGFVRMQNVTEAREAMQQLNRQEIKGRPIVVNKARSRVVENKYSEKRVIVDRRISGDRRIGGDRRRW